MFSDPGVVFSLLPVCSADLTGGDTGAANEGVLFNRRPQPKPE